MRSQCGCWRYFLLISSKVQPKFNTFVRFYLFLSTRCQSLNAELFSKKALNNFVHPAGCLTWDKTLALESTQLDRAAVRLR